MKKSLALSFVVGFGITALSLSQGFADHHEGQKEAKKSEGSTPRKDHEEHGNHAHQHKKKCGHKAEKHGDHTDYEHDGHHHKTHGKAVDECSGPEAEAAAKPAAAAPSSAH